MAGTPGPTRATRANSRAHSNAPTPVPPQRRAPRAAATRKAATPLPATSNAENNAYGSRGKVDLGSQQASNMDNDQFLRAFGSARDNAVVRVRTTRTTQVQQTRHNDDNDNDDSNDDTPEDDQDDQDEQDVTPATRGTEPARSTRSASRPASSVRFSVEPARRTAASASNRSPTRRQARNVEQHDHDVDDDDADEQPSALPRQLTRLRNNYDTSSPIAASSILQQRRNRALSVTEFNSGFSYEAPPLPPSASLAQQSSRSPAPRQTRNSSIARPRNAPATAAELHAAHPRMHRVLLESIPRWWNLIPTWAKLSPIIVTLAMLLLLMTGTSPADIVTSGVKVRPLSATSAWLRHAFFSSNATVPAAFSRQLNELQTSLSQLKSENTALRHALKSIEEILPSAVMIRKDPVTGQPIIPDDLLGALLGELRKDKALQSDRDSAVSWGEYLDKNKARIEQLIQTEASSVVRDTVSAHLSTGEILSKTQFMELLKKTWSQLETKHDQKLSTFENGIQRQIYRLANDQSGRGKGSVDAEHWIIQNMIRNQELSLLKVNYFSHSMGAYVDTALSSPTFGYPKSWIEWIRPARHYEGLPNKHNAALTRWDETFDCWCAAPSTDKGRAQLAVQMPDRIVPESITIEHIPSTGSLEIGSAPRTFEVWVLAPEYQAPSPADQARLVPECSSTDPPPGEGYICIGGGKYEIHGPAGHEEAVNHIQNFPFFKDVGLVSKVIVRVTSNWGKDWTCLYRVRMHGVNEMELEAQASRRDNGEH